MATSDFLKGLADYLTKNIPNSEFHPFPRRLPPGRLIRGFIALTNFHMPDASSIEAPQTVEGAVVIYIPASDHDLYSEEWSYMAIVDLLGFEDENALFKLFREDRTLGGICNAFIAEVFNLLPYEDEDNEFSEGSFWSISIPFRAYV